MTALLLLAAALSWAGPAEPALKAADQGDYETAFTRAHECVKTHNDAECMNVLAQLYHDGLGVKQDFAQSYKWRLAAAKKGFPDAQIMLGRAYELGSGVPKNPKESKKWYKAGADALRKLAEKNDTRAQINLGAMYDEGIGVEKNDKEAARWYAAAAIQGVQSAQINFAEMNADGRGVEQDDVKAAMWLMIAVQREKETDRWREVYGRVMPRLSPEQVQEAQKMAAMMKPVIKVVKTAGGH